MRYLVADTYYPAFLAQVYRSIPGLEERSYAAQLGVLVDHCFGTSDFYSSNLRALGHEATDVVVNCEPLQRRWARENGVRVPSASGWAERVLVEQVRRLRPDVLYVQDMNWPDPALYREVRGHVRLIAGQTAYPLRPHLDYGAFDLIFTSFPHYVPLLRRQGLAGEYLRLAFEPRVLERLGDPGPPTYGAVFVGGLSSSHAEGTATLEHVAGRLRLDTWGYGYQSLPPDAPLRRYHHGPAYGLDMYRVLAQSRVALNRHIDVAGRFANNMRLYEATGVGTCLVTDRRDNLAELFEPGREVLVYTRPEECAELVGWCLDHEVERSEVAHAGQQRTLREHTYRHRMAEVDAHVGRYLGAPAPTDRRVFLVGAGPAPTAVQRLLGLAGPLARRLPGPARAAAVALAGALPKPKPPARVSSEYEVITSADATGDLLRGWQDPAIPGRQRDLVRRELTLMYLGEPVAPHRVAAEALRSTGLTDPSLVEVGCASGYYSEVLGHLMHRRPRYVGLDYAPDLVAQAREHYPDVPFLIGDATQLPLRSASFDVVFSGTVLLHVPNYAAAIEESARVARGWCIFHRTPIVGSRPTTHMRKLAYGVPVVELVFREAELLGLIEGAGLDMVHRLSVDTHRVAGLDEPVSVDTLVCRKVNR